MILERFVIHNLFSYRGSCEFDLRPDDDTRNVLLIWGRNGYGKTSFINSLKLLFNGVSDELRKGVHAGRDLKRDHYLLGMGDEWIGIFNRQARTANEKKFWVELSWREAEGRVVVRRSWELENGKVGETLKVESGFGEPLEDHDGEIQGEARAFLQARLPESVMPFFIYDGERVQELAEANREGQMRQIEQLLDLADIDAVGEYLGKNLTAWRRESGDASQYRVNALQAELKGLEERRNVLDAEDKQLIEEIEETRYEIKRLDHGLQARREFALQSEEVQLSARRESVNSRLDERAAAFFESFTREAPLILFSELAGTAARELEKIATHPNRRLKDELALIFQALPLRLFDEPPQPVPVLEPGQIEFLRRKLARVLESYQPDPEDMTDGLFSLVSERADKVLKLIDAEGEQRRKRTLWANDLAEIRRLKIDLAEIDRKRNDVSNLAPQERQHFEERLAEKAVLETQLEQLQQRTGEMGVRKADLKRQLNTKQGELRAEERKLVTATAAKDKLGIAQRVKAALENYRSELKKRRREEIELAVNARFAELMTSHGLIRRIQVNDDFSLHYFDVDGRAVGMGNLSAGMKQLVAQALLWGLKDVSRREAPVVIDTPLARIDRGHQENLLRRYYPSAGRQVIVLPTDSELDRDKYALLKPGVYREYRLLNEEGDSTRVEQGGYF
jgi:DNA sulfur modification protein DndD